MSQPYNLANLLYPMFYKTMNYAGAMGLYPGQQQKAVAYIARTLISTYFLGNSVGIYRLEKSTHIHFDQAGLQQYWTLV